MLWAMSAFCNGGGHLRVRQKILVHIQIHHDFALRIKAFHFGNRGTVFRLALKANLTCCVHVFLLVNVTFGTVSNRRKSAINWLTVDRWLLNGNTKNVQRDSDPVDWNCEHFHFKLVISMGAIAKDSWTVMGFYVILIGNRNYVVIIKPD